jgi:hypothetical protein
MVLASRPGWYGNSVTISTVGSVAILILYLSTICYVYSKVIPTATGCAAFVV